MASSIGNMFLLSLSCPKKIICSTMMKNGQNVFLIISLDAFRLISGDVSVVYCWRGWRSKKIHKQLPLSALFILGPGFAMLLFGAKHFSKWLNKKQSPETREFWILWKTWSRNKTADPLNAGELAENQSAPHQHWIITIIFWIGSKKLLQRKPSWVVCLHNSRNKSFRQRRCEFSPLISHFPLSRCFYQTHVCFAWLRWLNSLDNHGDVSVSWSKPHVSIDGQSIIVSSCQLGSRLKTMPKHLTRAG